MSAAEQTSSNSKYKFEISSVCSFGRFLWCGNLESPIGSGFTLSNSVPTSQSAYYKGDHYGDINSYMVTFKVHMNPVLTKVVTSIEMYLPSGFLLGHNVTPLRGDTWIDACKISPDIIGQPITFLFRNVVNMKKYGMG